MICDKRVAGVYITLLATLSNLCGYVHKLYLFWAVDQFGLYWSQGVISLVAFTFAFYVRSKIIKMDELSKETWAVSDKVLQKIKNQ
jgi:ABC-type multidrug transport system fused ATPase/permease subunit